MDEAPASGVDDDEEFDLLDELGEDNGTPWRPADDEDQPKKIQGKVFILDEIEKDQKFGGGFASMISVTPRSTKDPGFGDVDAWSLRGYHGVLDKKIRAAITKGMKNGDLVAVAYLGETEGKNNTYHNYDLRYAPVG